MKTVLFVPGYGEDINSRDYALTIESIKSMGYAVEFVTIHWSRKTIKQWVNELNKVYEKYDSENTILAGFSFGAMIAFVAAAERNPSQLWLFSLSPYFSEDLKSERMKQEWLENIGIRRVRAFEKLNFVELLKKINTKSIFIYGDEELPVWPDITYRALAIKDSKEATVKIAKAAGHDVTHKNYIHTICRYI